MRIWKVTEVACDNKYVEVYQLLEVVFKCHFWLKLKKSFLVIFLKLVLKHVPMAHKQFNFLTIKD